MHPWFLLKTVTQSALFIKFRVLISLIWCSKSYKFYRILTDFYYRQFGDVTAPSVTSPNCRGELPNSRWRHRPHYRICALYLPHRNTVSSSAHARIICPYIVHSLHEAPPHVTIMGLYMLGMRYVSIGGLRCSLTMLTHSISMAFNDLCQRWTCEILGVFDPGINDSNLAIAYYHILPQYYQYSRNTLNCQIKGTSE